MSDKIKTENVSIEDLIAGTNLAPAVDVFAKSSGKYERDERFYQPRMGKNGEENVVSGFFLPSLERIMIDDTPTSIPIASFFQHSYEEGNQKIEEICPRTITNIFGKEKSHKCAICDYVYTMYQFSETESNEQKRERSLRKAKQISYANFYIEEDSLYPENNGRVVMMKLNYQLMDIIQKMAEGIKHKTIADKYLELPFDIFKLDKSFMLKKFIVMASPSVTNKKWNDYEKSRFTQLEKFMDGDVEKIKNILGQTHNLFKEIIMKKIESIKGEDALNSLVESMYGTSWKDMKKNNSDNNPNSPENIRAAVEKAKQKEETNEELPTYSEKPAQKAEPTQKPSPSTKPKTAPITKPDPVVEEDKDVEEDEVDFSKLYNS